MATARHGFDRLRHRCRHSTGDHRLLRPRRWREPGRAPNGAWESASLWPKASWRCTVEPSRHAAWGAVMEANSSRPCRSARRCRAKSARRRAPLQGQSWWTGLAARKDPKPPPEWAPHRPKRNGGNCSAEPESVQGLRRGRGRLTINSRPHRAHGASWVIRHPAPTHLPARTGTRSRSPRLRPAADWSGLTDPRMPLSRATRCAFRGHPARRSCGEF